MGPSPHWWFLHPKQRLLDQNYKSLWVPDLTYGFFLENSNFFIRITSLYDCQTSPVDLWMQNSVHRSRMTLAYWSQPSSVVLCIPNSAFSIRITSLYGSQPSSVVFACKTATFGSELQVSIGPRLRLLICECKTACLDPEWQVSIRPRSHVWFFCIQNSDFSIVSKGPSPHLWFLHAKLRLKDQHYKSLWVLDLTYDFLHSKQLL